MKNRKAPRKADSRSQPEDRRRLVDSISMLVLLAHRQTRSCADERRTATRSPDPKLAAEMRHMKGEKR